MKQSKGEIITILLITLGVLGIGAIAFKPAFLHGDSKRADASTSTTANLVAAQNKQSAEAAASVAKIGEVGALLPESREKSYITQEATIALAKLQPPDAQALLEAEKRKVAVLEGKVDEARSLYANALQRASVLEVEKTKAIAAREAVDLELSKVAAERLGAERERNQIIIVALLLLGVCFYFQLTHISTGGLATIVKDIEGGANPIHAIDTLTTPIQQWLTRIRKAI